FRGFQCKVMRRASLGKTRCGSDRGHGRSHALAHALEAVPATHERRARRRVDTGASSGPLLPLEEALQLVRAAGVAELAKGLGLDLADPLAGDVELLADLLQRVVGAHLDAEAHAQDLG